MIRHSFLSGILNRARALLPMVEAPAERPLTPRLALGVFMLMLTSLLALDWLAAGKEWSFQLYGINSLLAGCALAVGIAALFSTPGRGGNLVWLVFDVLASTYLALSFLQTVAERLSLWVAAGLFAVLLVGGFVWLVLSARRVFSTDPTISSPTRRAMAFSFSLAGALMLLPAWPVFEAQDFKRSTANVWEFGVALIANNREESKTVERDEVEERRVEIELAQPARLQAALERLAPREAGKQNVFVLGVAGWGGQQVFKRDLDIALERLGTGFDAQSRTLRLANNAMDHDSQPLASVQNIAAALRGIAGRMDPEKDLLVLSMNSHGSHHGFALQNGGLISRLLHPQALASMLDQAGIRHRVVIVSSCYSGRFVAPLANENTMVISASAADKVSFGCSDDRDLTFFGEAFYARSLNGGTTLVDAFSKARQVIASWEEEQKIPASDPQLGGGEALLQRFPAIVGAPATRRAAR